MIDNYITKEKRECLEREFLDHSNRIEGEYGNIALEDATQAWKYFTKDNQESSFSLESILHCHYLLMRRLRPDIAGKIRNCDVFIGGRRSIFISESLIELDIRKLNLYIIQSSILKDTTNKVKFTKDLHISFECIHPFEDGNGRVGRIIYNAHRLRLGLPIHIIHEGEEQANYYRWFK